MDKAEKRIKDHFYYLAHAEKIKAATRAYAAAHKKEIAAQHKVYQAIHRDELNQKALERYHRDPSKQAARSKKWKAKNQERLRQQGRALYAKTPERYIAYARKHQKAYPDAKRERDHRYRARKQNAFVGNVDSDMIYKRDKGICQVCQKSVQYNHVAIDHIVPLACGGTHEPNNVQLVHRRCNNKRWITGPAQTRFA